MANVILDEAFMDRVRSRVASLPFLSLEELLERIERTSDVEPLESLFDPVRNALFVSRVEAAEKPANITFDAQILKRLPIWNGSFVAIHLDLLGDVPATVSLSLGDAFAAAIAGETGIFSGQYLITDCVVGSVNFKIDANKIGNDLVVAAIVAICTAFFAGSAHPKKIRKL